MIKGYEQLKTGWPGLDRTLSDKSRGVRKTFPQENAMFMEH